MSVLIFVSLLLLASRRRFIDLIAFSRKRRSRKSISFSSSLLSLVRCASLLTIFVSIDACVEVGSLPSFLDSSNTT